jgi:L-fuconolactonase
MSATAANPYLPVRQEWLDLHSEPVLDAALPIIDPHHHLWDRPGWRYMIEDLLADVGSGHNIIATVFVQARAMHRATGPEEFRPIGETEFVNGVAAMSAAGIYGKTALCAGIVGHADLRGRQVQQVLETHIARAGDRFRGIRHIVAWDDEAAVQNQGNPAPPHLLADPAFREGFSKLAPLGLTFEAWCYHPQIDEVTALAQAFPDTKIVLNHFGGPLGIGRYAGRQSELFPGWAKSIQALAKCPNVYAKLGGLGMRINGFGFEEAAMPPDSARLAAVWKPYMDTTIEAFGADRCMFESNFPVDKGSYAYGPFWNACKLLAKDVSASERTALFSGTAKAFYRLEV